MIIGRRYWVWIWWGILALGVIGLVGAIHWGLQTKWKNLDEVLRGAGTIMVSAGMILLLNGAGGGAGETLLLAAFISFILAFAVGRERQPPASPPASPPEDPPAVS
jgi:H+/gluconate symporter-like permease